MTVEIASITFDSTDPVPLAEWWAARFGAEITTNMDGFFVLVAGGSLPHNLAFQKVDDPTPGKNKLHLDIKVAGDLDEAADAWAASGAGLVEKRNIGEFRWVTLSDPDGNEFCIANG